MLEIKDVKPPLNEAFHWNWILVILVFLVLMAITFGVFYFLKRKTIELEQDVQQIPAWDAAYQRLEELQRCNLVQAGRYQEYYTALSTIIRRYIEDRFHIKAPEMTTEEFIASLKHSSALNNEQKDILQSFLMAADMVKFAKHLPTSKDAQEAFFWVKQLIDATRHV